MLSDVHVQREPLFKAVLPIDLEPKKFDIEFLRLGFIEDSKNRRCLSEAHGTGLL
jgi:hypothetical protein